MHLLSEKKSPASSCYVQQFHKNSRKTFDSLHGDELFVGMVLDFCPISYSFIVQKWSFICTHPSIKPSSRSLQPHCLHVAKGEKCKEFQEIKVDLVPGDWKGMDVERSQTEEPNIRRRGKCARRQALRIIIRMHSIHIHSLQEEICKVTHWLIPTTYILQSNLKWRGILKSIVTRCSMLWFCLKRANKNSFVVH